MTLAAILVAKASAAGTDDACTVKFNSTGSLQWVRLLGGAGGWTRATAVGVDSSNNIYVAANTQVSTLDSQTKTGTSDGVLVKYSSAGTKLWTKLSGCAGQGTVYYGIAVDASGNSYVTGDTRCALDSQVLTGTRDMFVQRYSSDGTKQWTKLSGCTGAAYGYSIALDSNSNIFTTGYTNCNLEGESRTGTRDALLTKFDSTGSRQWTKLAGVAGGDTHSRHRRGV